MSRKRKREGRVDKIVVDGVIKASIAAWRLKLSCSPAADVCLRRVLSSSALLSLFRRPIALIVKAKFNTYSNVYACVNTGLTCHLNTAAMRQTCTVIVGVTILYMVSDGLCCRGQAK